MSIVPKVEAVARAMAAARGYKPDSLVYAGPFENGPSFHGSQTYLVPKYDPWPLWRVFVPEAEAAIGAGDLFDREEVQKVKADLDAAYAAGVEPDPRYVMFQGGILAGNATPSSGRLVPRYP